MNSAPTKPNIFKISNKELSQDAFITWLLQWAHPHFREIDSELHSCGTDFLTLVLASPKYNSKKIVNIEADRQWGNVDVWAEIFYDDGTKVFLIIEDKTFTGAREGQLEKYKEKSLEYCDQHKFEPIFTYFKIGSEPVSTLDKITNNGFNIVGRKQIQTCLDKYRKAEHSILRDYIDYIDDLEAAHLAFEKLPPKDWTNLAWVGFYQFVESNIDINTWHWIHNPKKAFWNLCFHWQYWNSYIPVYIQIEEDRICYKIALDQEETGLLNNESDIDGIQDYVFNFLMDFARQQGNQSIRRPARLAYNGNYRTLAVIDLIDYCGNPEELLDKESTLDRLRSIYSFYNRFMQAIQKVSFDDAKLNITYNEDSTD